MRHGRTPRLRIESLEDRRTPARLTVISTPDFSTTGWALDEENTERFDDTALFYDLTLLATPPDDVSFDSDPRSMPGGFNVSGDLQVRVDPSPGEVRGQAVELTIDTYAEIFFDRDPAPAGGPDAFGSTADFGNTTQATLLLNGESVADLAGGHTPADANDFSSDEINDNASTQRTINASIGDTVTVTFGGSGSTTGSWISDRGAAQGEAGVFYNVLVGLETTGEAPPQGGDPAFSAGAGTGGGQVTVYDAAGVQVAALFPYGPQFAGGVRVATADVTGDGVKDVITAPGPGGSPQVKVFDGSSRQEIDAFFAYEPTFTGGVFVSAEDLNNDGTAEIITSPDQGGGPRVRVFRGDDPSAVLADFFAIEDPDFRGGVRIGTGDINNDGTADLLAGAGFGGGPRVAGFDGNSLAAGGEPTKLFADFFVFEAGLRNGVFLSAGDLDGDGQSDLIAGAGPGGGPRVFGVDGAGLLADGGAQLNQVINFFAGDVAGRGGVRVASTNLDGDTRADLIVGPGEGAAPMLSVYSGADLPDDGSDPVATMELEAFASDFVGGVFVG